MRVHERFAGPFRWFTNKVRAADVRTAPVAPALGGDPGDRAEHPSMARETIEQANGSRVPLGQARWDLDPQRDGVAHDRDSFGGLVRRARVSEDLMAPRAPPSDFAYAAKPGEMTQA